MQGYKYKGPLIGGGFWILLRFGKVPLEIHSDFWLRLDINPGVTQTASRFFCAMI